jgi:hypothetical protein
VWRELCRISAILSPREDRPPSLPASHPKRFSAIPIAAPLTPEPNPQTAAAPLISAKQAVTLIAQAAKITLSESTLADLLIPQN